MGAYINPVGETKEDFLRREGKHIFLREAKEFDFSDKENLVVILVNNGPFTAAGIAYDKKELDAWTNDPTDLRPMTYWLVNKKKLYEVSNLEYYLKKEVE